MKYEAGSANVVAAYFALEPNEWTWPSKQRGVCARISFRGRETHLRERLKEKERIRYICMGPLGCVVPGDWGRGVEEAREEEREREQERHDIFQDGIFNALARSLTRRARPHDWLAWLLCHEFPGRHWSHRALDLYQHEFKSAGTHVYVCAMWRACVRACMRLLNCVCWVCAKWPYVC